METILGLCAGVGLAAAAGFRVFLPLLVVALSSRLGIVELSEQFAFLATWPALVALMVASVLEVGAYLVPWIDHAIDVVATPAAVLAGTLLAATQMPDVGPIATWAGAAALGGGTAAITQAATVGTRGVSTVSTAGLMNPVIGVVESAVAFVLAALSIVVPVLAAVAALVVLLVLARVIMRRRRARTAAATDAALAG